jgi:DNA repair protein RadC
MKTISRFDIWKTPTTIEKVKLLSSKEAFELIQKIVQDNNLQIGVFEYAIAIYANMDLITEGYQIVSRGSHRGTIISPTIVYRPALEYLASSVFVVHNHPSARLRPSKQDITLTAQLKEAGKILDIHFSDHLIINSDCSEYYSFTDEGTL